MTSAFHIELKSYIALSRKMIQLIKLQNICKLSCQFQIFSIGRRISWAVVPSCRRSPRISFAHVFIKTFGDQASLTQKSKTKLKMDKITKFWTGPLPPDSPYVKPYRFYYVQNGVEKNWDLLKVHDSVAIIIYHKTRKTLVFVKQFRPAVYHSIVMNEIGDSEVDLVKFPPKIGITIELCAGIVDKDKSFVEIAHEEVLEECGYDVPLARLEEVMTFRSGVGSSGSLQTMYFCDVTDDDKTTIGGGVDDEMIDVVEYSIDEARELVKQGAKVNSPPSCLLGIMWFLANKLNHYL